MNTKIKTKKIENFPLKEHTTLKIGGKALEAYIPENIEELKELKKNLSCEELTIIGQGSNILVSSQGVKEKVVLTKNLKNCNIYDETIVKAECGIKSANFAKILLENNLTGLEFLIGIPGSIGGAVTMNSSAHGQAIEDTIESVEVLDLCSNEIFILNKADLMLGYRDSFVKKNKHLVLNATFKLKKSERNLIAEKMNFHVNYRKERHPSLSVYPNAGSTFRNPIPDIFTGKLIEDLGGKDWQEGGAAIYEKHCNFIINKGNATSLDVSRLMNKMHSSIKKVYGYDLIAEIRFIGIQSQEEKEIWENFTVH